MSETQAVLLRGSWPWLSKRAHIIAHWKKHTVGPGPMTEDTEWFPGNVLNTVTRWTLQRKAWVCRPFGWGWFMILLSGVALLALKFTFADSSGCV